jgi:predicted glutamine amidotransferase
MCKLLGIFDIENRNNAEAFMAAALPAMTEHDRDGLGIMRLGENGVHIKRWVGVPTRFTEAAFSPKLALYRDALSPRFNEAGTPSENVEFIGVHSRLATCGISLQNTHPFYLEGTALMHNGVIPNPGRYRQMVSSCDSEALLSQYLDKGVKDRPEVLGEALSGLGGSFACLVANNNGVVDIWRDNKSTLVMAEVAGVGTVVCTTVGIIYDACKKTKKKVLDWEIVAPYSHIRWASHGEIKEMRVLDVQGYQHTPSSDKVDEIFIPDGKGHLVPLKDIEKMDDEDWQKTFEQANGVDDKDTPYQGFEGH